MLLRINPPYNPHQAVWDGVIEFAEQAISSSCLVGFHAARLMQDEISNIKQCGLKVLSVELLEHRLAAAQNAGALSKEEVSSLRGCHQAGDDNRVDRIAFYFTRSQLNDETATGRLFRSWGGENLYNSHENNPVTGPLLKQIGTPCIVVAALRVPEIEAEVGRRLLNVWCAHRGIQTEPGPEFGGVIRTNVPGKDILRIITIADPEFLTLTKHENWRSPLAKGQRHRRKSMMCSAMFRLSSKFPVE